MTARTVTIAVELLDARSRTRRGTTRAGLWMVVALALGLTACGGPWFQYQNVPFRQNAAMQAQLGNLGIRGDSSDYAFQRGAFLSECGVREIEASVDARMPQVKGGLTAFGDKATLSSIGSDIGYTRDELEKMSLLILSVNPVELTERLRQGTSPKCQRFIEKNRGATRFITGAAAVVDYEVLRNTTANLDVTGLLTESGNVALTTRLGETNSFTLSPAAVFAYRTSRLCWREGDGGDVVIMADDPGFDACPPGYETEPPEGWKWASVQPRQQMQAPHSEGEKGLVE